ncbi:uncharacterized protein [Halyomorpha halys]|uniref:uncharacterized protein n=1 Tax=Halyomorpha halys TaxID=286706 RepID=UPI0006D4D4EB|nr:uncharacterized protein LOC106686221 [Halyomorpha halys]
MSKFQTVPDTLVDKAFFGVLEILTWPYWLLSLSRGICRVIVLLTALAIAFKCEQLKSSDIKFGAWQLNYLWEALIFVLLTISCRLVVPQKCMRMVIMFIVAYCWRWLQHPTNIGLPNGHMSEGITYDSDFHL